MEEETNTAHLTDPELFSLAVPPVGEPEALPRHLSECLACSRALQEWKGAVRALAEEETEPIDRRGPAEWEALENRTIERMRRAGRTGRVPAVKWAIAIAASLLLAGLLLPARKPARSAPVVQADAAGLSTQDQKDDALLRDVGRLSRGEDSGSWSALAPEPGTVTSEEEQL